MKTKLLLRLSALCLGLVWGTSAMAVTQYCATPINSFSAGVATLNYTCKSLGGNSYQMLIEGTTTYKITGAPNINVGMNNINGTAGGSPLPLAFSATGNGSLSATFTSTATPGAPYVATVFFFIQGVPGDVRFDLPTNMDWTATCSGGCDLTANPTMGSASLVSVTHNSAILNVAGTDQKSDATSIFVVSATNVTEQVLTATDGKITLSGLTPNTDYEFVVKTQDKCGQKSDNSATVNVKTDTFVYHDFPTGHLQNADFGDPNGRILLTVKKESASSVSVEVQPNNVGTVIDFLQVELGGVAKTLGTEDGNPISGKVTYTDLASLSFNLNILWHTTSMGAGGRWTTNSFAVDESALYITADPTALNTNEIAKLAIYPNPAKDIVSLSSDMEMSNIQIFDMLGKAVEKATVNSLQTTINCSQLQEGQYIVRITLTNGNVLTKKIVKL